MADLCPNICSLTLFLSRTDNVESDEDEAVQAQMILGTDITPKNLTPVPGRFNSLKFLKTNPHLL